MLNDEDTMLMMFSSVGFYNELSDDTGNTRYTSLDLDVTWRIYSSAFLVLIDIAILEAKSHRV